MSIVSSSAGNQAAAAFHVSVWTSLDKTFDKLEQLVRNCRLIGLSLSKQRDLNSVHRNHCLSVFQFNDLCPNLSELLLYELLSKWHTPGKLRTQFESFVLILNFTDFKSKLTGLEG